MPLLAELVALYVDRRYKDGAPPELFSDFAQAGPAGSVGPASPLKEILFRRFMCCLSCRA
jgi:hypothetical protein